MKKIITTILLITALVFPIAVSAQAVAPKDVIPEFNPLCWQRQQCVQKRIEILGAANASMAEQGFVVEAPCNKKGDKKELDWGKCLPAGTANTEISFGGKTSFTDIGAFLTTNYNYLIGIAGILAVIMIIVAGVQWTTSGGNSEAIGSAKKKIGGALVGLFIAYMSYTILNTINPALVNLRLPSVFMVRPSNMVPVYCSDIKDSAPKTKFAQAAAPNANPPTSVDKAISYNLTFGKQLVCGASYFVAGAGNSTCRGDFCGTGQQCLNYKIEGAQVVSGYNCQESNIVLQLSIDGIAAKLMQGSNIAGAIFNVAEDDWLDHDSTKLHSVCGTEDNKRLYIGGSFSLTEDNTYTVYPVNQASNYYKYYLNIRRIQLKDTVVKNAWKCTLENGDKFLGVIITTEIGKKLALDDPDLSIGMNGGTPVYGVWGKDVKLNNYIPYQKMVSGTNLYINIGDSVLNNVWENKNAVPKWHENNWVVRSDQEDSTPTEPVPHGGS